jgi:hypothetical protein
MTKPWTGDEMFTTDAFGRLRPTAAYVKKVNELRRRITLDGNPHHKIQIERIHAEMMTLMEEK